MKRLQMATSLELGLDSREFYSVFFPESPKGEKNALIPSGLAGGLTLPFFCVFCVGAAGLRLSPLVPRRSW